MKTIRIIKNIDSILQVTKDTVNQSSNYYDYIINHNNTLYQKQLPLLMRNVRLNALILSKAKGNSQINTSLKNNSEDYSIKNSEKNNKITLKLKNSLSPLYNIRNLRIRSKKLPPLCPLFNNRGELVPSIVKSSKVIFNKIMNYDDNMNNINNINNALSPHKMENTHKVLRNIKNDSKLLKYNKSCDFYLKIDYDESENKYFNEPDYDTLKYNESQIFGKKKLYEDIIRKKIIELQSIYNKNLTTQKEKIYKYGLGKIKMCLTLDSLKIKINNIKNENSPSIEKGDKCVFQYTLPFALLPLFYFKDVDTFLMILSKLIIYNESNETFEIVKKDDEIIANILKNCIDFNVEDEKSKQFSFFNTLNQNNIAFKEFQKENNKNNKLSRTSKNISLINNNDITNYSLTSTVNDNNLHKYNSINNDNNEDINNVPNRNRARESVASVKKKIEIKQYNIFNNKTNNDSLSSISIYEFLWITSKKSYILTIETPLITVQIPSCKNKVMKYINYDLLFYLYNIQFVMWDFYIIKYLSTFKLFRNFLEQISSVPQKKNISFYITQPKYKRNILTCFDLISIVTTSINWRLTRGHSTSYDNNSNININQNNYNDSYNEDSSRMKKIDSGFKKDSNRRKNTIDNNLNNNSDNNNNNGNTNEEINNNNINSSVFNTLFIQKGLLIVASFINTKKDLIKEYTFHFNIDQLRKFQLMEVLVDKLSFFIKFVKINYEQESISFDFESFNAFDVSLWISDMKKYNYKYLKKYKTLYEEKKNEDIPMSADSSVIKIFQGLVKNTQIKIEVKYPLIYMVVLDELGYKIIEKINIDNRVEKLLSQITIYNPLDLTKQIINILKENNFCRIGGIPKKSTKRKTIKPTKQKQV